MAPVRLPVEDTFLASAAGPRTYPLLRPVGEAALLVELGERIGPAVQQRVRALDAALAAHPFAGFLEAVPAYVNVLVRFDAMLTDHAAVAQALALLLERAEESVAAPRLRDVAVCYEGDLAPDLDRVAQACGLGREAVIAAHLAGDYSVVMYGFAPGYAYLSGVTPVLSLPRKPAPVRNVPAGSVLIAGAQCLVSTLTMPTGWWIIGRSPTAILADEGQRPFLFDVGDRVRFHRIDRGAFDAASGARHG